MTQDNQSPVGRTRNGEFTLDQIAEMQPGLGMLMPQVSDRYWILYYAARGGNWGLARYQLHELQGLLELGATTRPKWANHLTAFINGHVSAIQRAIEQEDFGAFESAYQQGIEATNRYHVQTGHSEIIWQLPTDPPRHLSLKPPSS